MPGLGEPTSHHLHSLQLLCGSVEGLTDEGHSRHDLTRDSTAHRAEEITRITPIGSSYQA